MNPPPRPELEAPSQDIADTPPAPRGARSRLRRAGDATVLWLHRLADRFDPGPDGVRPRHGGRRHRRRLHRARVAPPGEAVGRLQPRGDVRAEGRRGGPGPGAGGPADAGGRRPL